MSDLVIEQITLEKANLIIKNAIDKAREIKINPYHGSAFGSSWSNKGLLWGRWNK